jgi:hypothetical protein
MEGGMVRYSNFIRFISISSLVLPLHASDLTWRQILKSKPFIIVSSVVAGIVGICMFLFLKKNKQDKEEQRSVPEREVEFEQQSAQENLRSNKMLQFLCDWHNYKITQKAVGMGVSEQLMVATYEQDKSVSHVLQKCKMVEHPWFQLASDIFYHDRVSKQLYESTSSVVDITTTINDTQPYMLRLVFGFGSFVSVCFYKEIHRDDFVVDAELSRQCGEPARELLNIMAETEQYIQRVHTTWQQGIETITADAKPKQLYRTIYPAVEELLFEHACKGELANQPFCRRYVRIHAAELSNAYREYAYQSKCHASDQEHVALVQATKNLHDVLTMTQHNIRNITLTVDTLKKLDEAHVL